MAIFVVLEPPGLPEAESQERALLLRDGFHLFAFLIPVVWFLWHRLWIEAAGALLVAVAIGGIAAWSGMPAVGVMLTLASAILFGFEASSLRIAAMKRAGFDEWGSIEAGNARDAEIRYAAEAERRSIDASGDRWSAPQSFRYQSDGEVGLVSYPWAR